MRKFACTISVILGLTGCAQTVVNNAAKDIPPPAASYVLTDADVKVVETGVRNRLKDPMSATFGPMTAMQRTDGMVTVCGYVNARNSFGGYAGMQPFMGLMTLTPVHYFGMTGMGGTDTDTTVIILMCRKAGITI